MALGTGGGILAIAPDKELGKSLGIEQHALLVHDLQPHLIVVPPVRAGRARLRALHDHRMQRASHAHLVLVLDLHVIEASRHQLARGLVRGVPQCQGLGALSLKGPTSDTDRPALDRRQGRHPGVEHHRDGLRPAVITQQQQRTGAAQRMAQAELASGVRDARARRLALQTGILILIERVSVPRIVTERGRQRLSQGGRSRSRPGLGRKLLEERLRGLFELIASRFRQRRRDLLDSGQRQMRQHDGHADGLKAHGEQHDQRDPLEPSARSHRSLFLRALSRRFPLSRISSRCRSDHADR